MKTILTLTIMLAVANAVAAHAALHGDMVDYTIGGTTFSGYLAYDDARVGPRPGVLIVHEWYGLNDYARQRADQLAQLGYVAFAVDMYGKGVLAANNQEAGRLAGGLKGDRVLMRQRITAALETLLKQSSVDKQRVAAIGYCFGGTVALELARSGAAIAGVVSFHGGLDAPTPAAPNSIKAKVLVLNGGDDGNAGPEQVTAFEQEMRASGADWQMMTFGGAVHGFTNPANGADPKRGVAYNADADRRSWSAMTTFFQEIFK